MSSILEMLKNIEAEKKVLVCIHVLENLDEAIYCDTAFCLLGSNT